MAKERKEGAPACGLYLRIVDDKPFEEAFPALREATFVINRSAYEKNLHVLEVGGDPADTDSVDRLNALVLAGKHDGLVVIVREHAALASQAQADGVLLDNPEDIAPARELLGPDAIIGLRCGLSRHTAEKAMNAGADYVSFASGGRGDVLPPESLILWWGAGSETPALVEGSLTNDDCARYVRAGATFLEGTDYVWNHPQGIKQGTVDMLYAIELALDSQSVQ